MKWSLTVVLLLALAGVAGAEEILLIGGDSIEGEIQSVDHTGITVKTAKDTMVVAPADLDAHFFYEAWNDRVGDSAEGRLRLAVFAYENGLFNQARSQYRKAQKLDKDLVAKFEEEIVPKIKEDVAAHLLGLTKQAIKSEDWDKARRLASKILTELEDTKAAEEARESLGSIHLWTLTKDQDRLVRNLAKYLPKDEKAALATQERVTKRLEPIQRKVEKTEELMARGLRTKSNNRQKGIFQKAAKEFEREIEKLDKLAGEAAGDEALIAHIQELRSIAVREGVQAYINAGTVFLIRRDYQNASDMANRALLLDPQSAPAKQFQQRVVTGSQMRGGWWGRGR